MAALDQQYTEGLRALQDEFERCGPSAGLGRALSRRRAAGGCLQSCLHTNAPPTDQALGCRTLRHGRERAAVVASHARQRKEMQDVASAMAAGFGEAEAEAQQEYESARWAVARKCTLRAWRRVSAYGRC